MLMRSDLAMLNRNIPSGSELTDMKQRCLLRSRLLPVYVQRFDAKRRTFRAYLHTTNDNDNESDDALANDRLQ
jgi:hypothetical protein